MLCPGYPDDEAASLQSLQYRQQHANDLFLGYYEDSLPMAVSSVLFVSPFYILTMFSMS